MQRNRTDRRVQYLQGFEMLDANYSYVTCISSKRENLFEICETDEQSRGQGRREREEGEGRDRGARETRKGGSKAAGPLTY